VEIVIEGLDDETFQTGETSMLAFSHASTMDAFILSQCIPVSMYTIAKSELFLIPFFSLLLSSYGGIAVNRGDIKQAIKALRFSIEKATSGKDKQAGGTALAISPEGTRSARGQLIAFKKGPFYTWEQLQCNVVPFVVFGAYDLYPPGKQMSVPGRVVVRYCPPITLSDLTTPIEHDTDGHKRREEMALLLRERMLATMLDSPNRVGDESPTQSWPSWLVNKVSYTSLIGANVAAGYCMYDYCHSHEISYAVITSVTVGIVLGSSVCVYFYNLYLCRPPSIPGCEPGSPVKAKNSDLELKSNERGGNDGNVDSNGNAKVKTS
jgi:1-acyl-sn-glycerol-3-phosphate acyltransferase